MTFSLTIKTAADLAAEARAAARESRRAEARTLLAKTDWMVIRAAEGGKPVPPDVTAARAAARKTLSDA
jgi:hypothetical protein